MATVRLTSASASSAPRPVVGLTWVSASAPAPGKKVRLTSVAAGFEPAPTGIVRLTEVSAQLSVVGLPPVAMAGSDIDAAAAETWQLDGSDSSVNGTIVSRQWRQVGKSPANAPDLVLSSSTVAAPTFVAPIRAFPCSYVLTYQVRESTGLLSNIDEVTVDVAAADRAVPTSSGWVPAGRLVATSAGWV